MATKLPDDRSWFPCQDIFEAKLYEYNGKQNNGVHKR